MSLSNSSARYGSLAKLFHWLTALGIFIMIPLGITANNAPSGNEAELAWKVQLFSAHKTLGIAVLVLAVIRIAWMLTQPKPAPLHPERKLETLAAETVHILLYGSLILVPISGWIEHAATTGFAPILWPLGQSLPFVPQSPALAETMAGAHIVLERVLVISLFLHIAGALKHAFVDRDQTLARMLPGQADIPETEVTKHANLPIVLALVAWVAAFGVAVNLGVFDHGPAQSAELEQVDTDWQVQTGELGLTIQQFGKPVTGAFETWTAAITYDETLPDGKIGTVEVTVSIGSVSIGSVTSQALGADYFDNAQFPTATFTADILRTEGAHRADGTLNLRGASLPLSFPFDLKLDGDSATMTASFALNRQDFGIGANMQDEGQLANTVDVNVALTATR
ncbi:hypothetical protein TRP8649_02766 [Pelagimonas phthalicica]|uniref:Lipid/polyisoprenoid-binding YceI-like domain-containing protein n=1 Tax=Pelagimonas phthalicica TaxID=1037362 RepID=A0A238JD51_9RHOB|nr:cytochrome b/b6 domain-containing protein [Pelagimonas phthalicica]TDS91592.1 cytochrome b561 [Pelagimonas phthalicica]SMX28641.1 hypothetical protein TRP8649_02766 [Pelagimonas phthalicica]